jgi:hypothetical protein
LATSAKLGSGEALFNEVEMLDYTFTGRIISLDT